MQKTEFRNQATQALLAGNILDFQKAIKARLQANLEQNLEKFNFTNEQKLFENRETEVRSDIEAASRSFGGNNPIYDEGVLIIDFEDKQAVEDFSDWLDNYADIENYEVNILFNDEEADSESEVSIDFDDIVDDANYTFEFIIYLNPDVVTYNDEDDYKDISEAKRIIKTSAAGGKTIKMQCNPGFKWDDESKSCQKIVGSELANRRKGTKRRLITMKSRGAGAKAISMRKLHKALKFRKALGLDK